jgi:hypothetical protein
MRDVATPNRNVRIPQPRWDALHSRAAAQGTTASAVVNALLELYLTGVLDGALACWSSSSAMTAGSGTVQSRHSPSGPSS